MTEENWCQLFKTARNIYKENVVEFLLNYCKCNGEPDMSVKALQKKIIFYLPPPKQFIMEWMCASIIMLMNKQSAPKVKVET